MNVMISNRHSQYHDHFMNHMCVSTPVSFHDPVHGGVSAGGGGNIEEIASRIANAVQGPTLACHGYSASSCVEVLIVVLLRLFGF